MDMFTFIGREWLLITVLFALIALYVTISRKDSGLPMSSSELVRLVNAEQALLLDVRSTGDFSAGHIQGSINIPHTKVAARISELEKYRETLIVVTDQMGQHAGRVGAELSKQGYQVRRLAGGISGWQQDNLPLVRGGKS